VGENVPGLIGWSNGLVFDEVQTDLESEGYEVRAFVLPAAGVNAPHRRDRIWFIAYAAGESGERMQPKQRSTSDAQQGQFRRGCCEMGKDITDALRQGYEGRMYKEAYTSSDSLAFGCNSSCYEPRGWQDVLSEPPICSRNDGLSDRLDGITFPKWRTESLKAYGNAIVPAVALQIFTAINQYENLVKTAQ
jgi:DNA (cytosine-5)-methyltransferase 1